MKNSLKLVRLDTMYCNYLRTFDNKVPYNYHGKEIRPFIGILFKVNKYLYFAPLSSPKLKHLKLKSKLDFMKINGGKLGVINFNNMLPVMKKNIIEINLNKKGKNELEKKYLKLLNEQILWLNRNKQKIYKNSKNLYEKYLNKTLNEKIAKRCCDFQLLEKKCKEYNQNKQIS